MRKAPIASAAFSLVELSIVLVILGLLTGGILGGQSLIKAAELRSVSQEYAKYTTALMQFRDKYFALPGDMPNATAFWGAIDGNDGLGGDCHYASSAGTTATCNGNGSGELNSTSATNHYEMFRVWHHLANAGLIEGSYTGIKASGGFSGHMIIGQNIPASKFSRGSWSMRVSEVFSAHPNVFDGTYRNWLNFGGAVLNDANYGTILTPQEMWNIDTKMDDGKPAQGKVWTRGWDLCTTAASAADLSAEYVLSNSGLDCGFIVRDYM
ncbi:MAG: hypothetical protein DI582_04590 [Azospirillum brasilense]|nr:MAG: hypothetical protein DI582_04590 [Azospirillum brasilense]